MLGGIPIVHSFCMKPVIHNSSSRNILYPYRLVVFKVKVETEGYKGNWETEIPLSLINNINNFEDYKIHRIVIRTQYTFRNVQKFIKVTC